jgi:hypothetical protein
VGAGVEPGLGLGLALTTLSLFQRCRRLLSALTGDVGRLYLVFRTLCCAVLCCAVMCCRGLLCWGVGTAGTLVADARLRSGTVQYSVRYTPLTFKHKQSQNN